jgi:hypothetical protein
MTLPSRFRHLPFFSLVVIVALATVACGGRGRATYQGIDLPRSTTDDNAPGAWLVGGERAMPATLAAFNLDGEHADPAYGYPGLEAMKLGPDGLVIVLDSRDVSQAEVSIREWKVDGRIVPLVAKDLRPLTTQLDAADGLSVLTIGTVPEGGDYLLRLHVIDPNGDVFYVWRLDTTL